MEKKITTDDFVKKATEIHGIKYDYSKTVYSGLRKKVCVICPEHGEFFITPEQHLKGQGCKLCNNSKTEKFILKARQVHGDKYDYSKVKYINPKEKVCIICPEHGEFWQRPYNHLYGGNCPLCVHNKYTTESFIEAAKAVHGNKYDYSKTVFKTVNEKVCIILHEKDRYGNEIGEFWQYPLTHLNGGGCAREKRGIKEDCWEKRVCPVCGKEFKIRKKYEKICCSEECRKSFMEDHKEEISEKKSESLRRTYACKSTEEKKAAVAKLKATCLLKYGKENFSQTDEGRKIISINMKNFKSKYDNQYKNEVLIPKYKEICNLDNLDLIEFRNRFDCTVKCRKCGTVFDVKTLGYLTDSLTKNRCRTCHPLGELLEKTNFEETFEVFMKELGVSYIRNNRKIIYPQEIDFYLPDYNIGFELDGLYWHSDVYKDKNYHLGKTDRCASKGIKLIHIFEDEWNFKEHICKDRIKSILGMNSTIIWARKCCVREISSKESNMFLESNHLQGKVNSKYSIGLFNEDELISVMTFGGLRKSLGSKSVENEYELFRYCSKLGTNVVGGASKMLKFFIRKYNPKRIISYCDLRWSNGSLYESIGFNFLHKTKPNYFYVIGGKRKNRFNFRKNILVEKYGCDEKMTEKEFCSKYGINRIYDCGNNLYEITF